MVASKRFSTLKGAARDALTRALDLEIYARRCDRLVAARRRRRLYQSRGLALPGAGGAPELRPAGRRTWTGRASRTICSGRRAGSWTCSRAHYH